MMSNTQLLAIAKKQIGNNGSKYRKYVGVGGSWCDMFVFWLYDANGNGPLLTWKGNQRYYCPASIKWCERNLAQLPPYLAMACDPIYFDWDGNGNPNHIGIVEKRRDSNSVYTIEGNTSGGKVDDKCRTGYIEAVFRPHFKPNVALKKEQLKPDGAFEYKSIYMLAVALGVTPTGIFTKDLVMALQRKAGTKPDGAWGKNTSRAVQKLVGLKGKAIDGAWGKQSTVALQKWINAKVFPVSKTSNTTVKKDTVTKTQTEKPKETKPTNSSLTRQKMKAIGHARKDYDHKAGDSSGKEVLRSKFIYKASSGSVYNWTYVFRPKDIAKAEKAASMCEKAIANNAIGYCSKGETAYGKAKAMTKLAKAAKYDLSKIKTKCGCSCGDLICLCNHWAGLSTVYIGSGKQLAESYKKNNNFQTIKYKKGMQLYRGDVLITAHSNGKNNHVVMCL